MRRVMISATVVLFTVFVLISDYLQYLWHGSVTHAQYVLAIFLLVFGIWGIVTSFFTHSRTQ